MKVIQINAVYKTMSTGKICYSVSELLNSEGVENLTLYSHGKNGYKNTQKIGNNLYYKIQALKSRIFGNFGFNSHIATKKMLKVIDDFKPDIVQLHNLHAHNVNLSMLFNYFKTHKEIKIFWTFHDCWEFTSYCPHFTIAKCDKWKMGCYKCPQRKGVSWFFDRSQQVFRKKEQALSGQNMTIITPSHWLAELVKQSFLKDYPVKVINNGIDLTIFKPTESNFRKKYNIPEGTKILLAVSAGWSERKGFDVIIELAKRLDVAKYRFVVVGTDNKTEKALPEGVISIHRTNNQTELAEIYTSADVFVNPTREENYPTVNMEAIACGTPVITFRTGGSPEILTDKTGIVVDCDDVDAMQKGIEDICEKNLFNASELLERAKSFDANARFRDYIKLYRED